eukprot:829947-Pyramimonas_sp.AAC.1
MAISLVFHSSCRRHSRPSLAALAVPKHAQAQTPRLARQAQGSAAPLQVRACARARWRAAPSAVACLASARRGSNATRRAFNLKSTQDLELLSNDSVVS